MGVSRQEGSAYMDDASERAIEEDMLDQFNYFDDCLLYTSDAADE